MCVQLTHILVSLISAIFVFLSPATCVCMFPNLNLCVSKALCVSVCVHVCSYISCIIVAHYHFQEDRLRQRGITEMLGHPSSTVCMCRCVCMCVCAKAHSSLTNYVIFMHDLARDFKHTHTRAQDH